MVDSGMNDNARITKTGAKKRELQVSKICETTAGIRAWNCTRKSSTESLI